MIEDDVRTRYRPGRGKLRLVVVTDGQDTLSPAEYNGSERCGINRPLGWPAEMSDRSRAVRSSSSAQASTE